MLKPGDRAPDFKLDDQFGNEVSLSDYRGKKLLIYFYPKASTPGCTTQACSIRDAMGDLEKSGIAPLGISPDKPPAQKRFDDKYGLAFPLLSDPDHRTAEAYGVWKEKSMYGKQFMGIVRSSFLIDGEGKIIQSWYKVSPKDTVPNAMETL